MKLSARPLTDVMNVNDFVPSPQVEFSVGDSLVFYFQLIDLEKNLAAHGWNPPGLRYIPEPAAIVSVVFSNIDDSRQFTRLAVQPFLQDQSIWAVPVLGTDPLGGTISLKITVTQNGIKRSFTLQGALLGSV
jgi:hypothetical protein